MESATAHPASTEFRTNWRLVLTVAAALLVLTLFVESPKVLYAVLGVLFLFAYLAPGDAAAKIFVLTALPVFYMSREDAGAGTVRLEAFLPLFGLILWLADRATLRVRPAVRPSGIDRTIVALIVVALVGALHGLIVGRESVMVGNETLLYVYYGAAIVVSRIDFSERRAKQLFGLLIAIAVGLSLVYVITFFGSGGHRPADDRQHLLNLAIPLVVAFFLKARSGLAKLSLGLLVLLMLLATYVTLTRALWLYVPLSLLLLWFLFIHHKHVAKPGKGAIALVAVLLVLVVVQAARVSARGVVGKTAKAVAGRAESMRSLNEDVSLIARLDLGSQALQRWSRSPILGSGIGDVVFYRVIKGRVPLNFLDSSFLTVLWKLGLVGLAVFVVLYVLFLKRLWFVYRHATSEFQMLCAAGTFVAFVGLFLIGIESGVLIIYRFNLIWAILMGVFDRWARQIKEHTGPAIETAGKHA